MIFDVGDITPGLPMDDANARLASTIAEIVRRGAIPFVLGGSCELCYGLAVGIMSVAGGGLGVAYVSSQLDVKPPMMSVSRDNEAKAFPGRYTHIHPYPNTTPQFSKPPSTLSHIPSHLLP